MGNKTLLIRAAELVGIFLSLAGGFLLNVIPIDDNNIWLSQFAVGVGFSVIFVALLLTWSLAKHYFNFISIKAWHKASIVSMFVFFTSAIYYFTLLNNYTYVVPQADSTRDKIIRVHGRQFSVLAQTWWQDQNNPSKSEMLKNFGYKHDAIWTEKSTRSMELGMLIVYLTMTLSLALSVFTLSEGTLKDTKIDKEDNNRD